MSILKYIDVKAYITLIEKAYVKSWQNIVPTETKSDELPLSDDSIITKDNYAEYIDFEDAKTAKFIQEFFNIEVA